MFRRRSIQMRSNDIVETLNEKIQDIVTSNEALYRFLLYSRLAAVYNAINISYHKRRNNNLIRLASLETPNGLIIEHTGIKLKIDISSVHDLGFVVYRNYGTELVEFFKQYVRTDTVFVDAGANNGFFSLVVGSLLNGTGRIYSFEPVLNTYKRLLQNIELNGYKNIKPYNFALGSREYDALINISDTEDGLNSLVDIKDSSMKVPVHVVTLDEVVGNQNVDIIKIDVEGFEEEVMKGAVNIIRSNDNIKIIFEHNPVLIKPGSDNGFGFLQQLGFKIYAMRRHKGKLILKQIYNVNKMGFCDLLAMRRL